ncbi:MAG: class I SAM-dependent methyltransferase [Pseudomonadota bacterium]|nr:class I SAM-dependent methyltransferase [Pseudomonadota bacterium]
MTEASSKDAETVRAEPKAKENPAFAVLVRLPAVIQKAAGGLPTVFIGGRKTLAKSGKRLGVSSRHMLLSLKRNTRTKSLTGYYSALLLLLHRLGPDRAVEQLFFRPTREFVRLTRLRIPTAARERGHDYYPTPRLVFDWAMSLVGGGLDRSIFIDYGAGRGRPLLMACRFPFEKAIGVEISEELTDDCRMNIAQFPRSRMLCRDVECICTDVANYTPPAQDAVHYLFDPFEPEVFAALLDRMAAGNRVRRLASHIVTIGMSTVSDGDIVAKGYEQIRPTWRLRLKLALFSPYRIAVFRSPAAARDASHDEMQDSAHA